MRTTDFRALESGFFMAMAVLVVVFEFGAAGAADRIAIVAILGKIRT
jgi:hypothetical protein